MRIRIPTDTEYLKLCDITNGNDALMHWEDMGSWVNDTNRKLPANYRVRRGLYSARNWYSHYLASGRCVSVGFRPTVEGLNIDTLATDKDGLVVLGTLYMAGEPVKVPKAPTYYGDVEVYVSGAALEMRAPLDDPAYQVKGFILGDGVSIADRVLLKYISYSDIEEST